MDKQKQTVFVMNKKKHFCLDLEQYLARTSKKNKHTVVFEGINKEISPEYMKVSLKFEAEIFQVVFREAFSTTLSLIV